MPLREVINFTQYVTEDLCNIVDAVERLADVTPESIRQSWGRDRPIEFVPYAFSNSKRTNYTGNGTVTERRYVSEGIWGGTAFRVGLVDPRAAHSSPVAKLLSLESLGGAPQEMTEQLISRLMWLYPTQERNPKTLLAANPHLVLRFRPGVKEDKDEDEKRLVRLLKARVNLEKVMTQSTLLVQAGERAVKDSATLTSHLKGADAVHIPGIQMSLTEVMNHAVRVDNDIVRKVFADITAEALRLAHKED
jgi:hypothetical protein